MRLKASPDLSWLASLPVRTACHSDTADIMNRKRTGERLSPCLTPLKVGGAPYRSSRAISTSWCSKVLRVKLPSWQPTNGVAPYWVFVPYFSRRRVVGVVIPEVGYIMEDLSQVVVVHAFECIGHDPVWSWMELKSWRLDSSFFMVCQSITPLDSWVDSLNLNDERQKVELLKEVEGFSPLFVSVIHSVWAEYLVEFIRVIVKSCA
eukprot:scaffold70358_cov69-Cyclotella_meneghiniana.AAC.5